MGTDLELTNSSDAIARLPEKEFKVAQTIHSFNQLRSFKLTAVEILEWKDSLVKIIPDLDIGALEFAIQKMMTEELEYDKDAGIQNIFRALKRVERLDNGYRIKIKWAG